MPLNAHAREQQEEYGNAARPISEFEGQVITVTGLRTVTKKDGSVVNSKKTGKPLMVLVLTDGTEIWPTPNVLNQLDLSDPTGTYTVRGFNTDYGNRGFALTE